MNQYEHCTICVIPQAHLLTLCIVLGDGSTETKVYMTGADAKLICAVPGEHTPDNVVSAETVFFIPTSLFLVHSLPIFQR